ncbi:hypothetical protein E2562_021850 [Oryza meyeriana var. granulata]|uniref:Uncharacterized protein n=1 Tax=Oryza meyeriana var. granulata TaxID=110450 RepID=A0A6G1C9N1_9ORYZ|nr:hypothetical protein E2562_021850 [Oryza meyeriana var. granulata]
MSARHAHGGEHRGNEAATGEVRRLTHMCRATTAAGVFPNSYIRASASGCLARSVWVVRAAKGGSLGMGGISRAWLAIAGDGDRRDGAGTARQETDGSID